MEGHNVGHSKGESVYMYSAGAYVRVGIELVGFNSTKPLWLSGVIFSFCLANNASDWFLSFAVSVGVCHDSAMKIKMP
jgi:hypothetical protein